MNLLERLDQMKKDSEYRYEYEAEKQCMKICRLLREKRESLGMTQEDLARKAGMTRQLVSKVETYASSPTIRTLVRYTKGLGIDISQILEDGLK